MQYSQRPFQVTCAVLREAQNTAASLLVHLMEFITAGANTQSKSQAQFRRGRCQEVHARISISSIIFYNYNRLIIYRNASVCNYKRKGSYYVSDGGNFCRGNRIRKTFLMELGSLCLSAFWRQTISLYGLCVCVQCAWESRILINMRFLSNPVGASGNVK